MNNARFTDEPPTGAYRSIFESYRRHSEAIRRVWDDILNDRAEGMTAVLVKNANRMMTSADPMNGGIADHLRGWIQRTGPLWLPNPYEVVLFIGSGETVEFPWDFVKPRVPRWAARLAH